MDDVTMSVSTQLVAITANAMLDGRWLMAHFAMVRTRHSGSSPVLDLTYSLYRMCERRGSPCWR